MLVQVTLSALFLLAALIEVTLIVAKGYLLGERRTQALEAQVREAQDGIKKTFPLLRCATWCPDDFSLEQGHGVAGLWRGAHMAVARPRAPAGALGAEPERHRDLALRPAEQRPPVHGPGAGDEASRRRDRRGEE